MSYLVRELGIYLHLARASELRRRPMVRDRLLVICAGIASEIGLAPIAAFCRHKILQHNASHLLRRWPTLEEAMEEESFLTYFRQILRRYPLEKAEQMLVSLGIEMAREREAYFSDYEYAAAILGVTPAELDERFGPSLGSELH